MKNRDSATGGGAYACRAEASGSSESAIGPAWLPTATCGRPKREGAADEAQP